MENQFVGFGKLKELTYEQALLKNKQYCKWIGNQPTESDLVKQFQLWLLEKGVIENINERIKNNGEPIIGK